MGEEGHDVAVWQKAEVAIICHAVGGVEIGRAFLGALPQISDLRDVDAVGANAGMLYPHEAPIRAV